MRDNVYAFVKIVWAVVGVLVWLPLLLLSVIWFVLLTILAAFTGKPSLATFGSQLLDDAIPFYARGFDIIDEVKGRPPGPDEPIDWKRVTRAVAVTAVAFVFWALLLGCIMFALFVAWSATRT
jgi:hypothetical protein